MRKSILLISGIFVLQLSCKKENRYDCTKGTGSIQEKVIDFVAPIKTVETFDNIIAEIVPGAQSKVTVIAGSKLIPLIDVQLSESGNLVIRDNNKCNWSRSFKNEIKVRIETSSLERIKQSGTGKVFSSDTLRAFEFTIDILNSGDVDVLLHVSNSHCNIHAMAGDIHASGISGVSYVYNSGYGFVYAKDLVSDITFLGNHNTGTCYVNAKDILEVDITYSGDVYYTGNPKSIKEMLKGTGKLLPL